MREFHSAEMRVKVETYDVIIIGGGPAGYTAALELASRQKQVLLFEKNKLGGVCLHSGCIPTKSLLKSAEWHTESKNKNLFSIENAIQKKEKDIKALYTGLHNQLKNPYIHILYEPCVLTGKAEGKIQVKAFKDYAAKAVILAAGSHNHILKLEGHNAGVLEKWILYSEDVFDYKNWGKNIVIIGGGTAGIEFATFLNAIGCHVTIIEMAAEILTGKIDNDICDILKQKLLEQGVDIIEGANICEFDDHLVIYEKNASYFEMECDQAIITCGREGNIDGIGIEKLGVELNGSFVKTDNKCMTNIDGIYACGDIIGKSMLAHTAYKEAEIAVKNICKETAEMSYYAIPSVIFSNPETASAGYTECAAKEHGIKYYVKRCPMSFSSRYMINERDRKGICKLIFNEQDVIIGGQIIGNGAAELICYVADMIQRRENIFDIKEKIYPHPSIVEILRETVRGTLCQE